MCAMKRNASAKPATEQVVETPVQEEETAPIPEEEPINESVAVVHEDRAPVVAKKTGTMVKLYDDLENAFVAEFGVLPKLKASNGNVMDSSDNLLGASIDVQIMSWNRQYVVGPCDNNAPSELVKYSLDRDFFEDGTGTLNEYVQELKKEGWVNTAVKEYFDVVCVLTRADKKSDLVGEMVQLQLSPTSVKSFSGFCLQTAFKIARGLLPENAAENVTVSVAVVTAKGNTWSKFDFKPAKQG